ncbi:hypothetical protein L7F22_024960 [Adiantum nelumboides]|nr:hypothetical protein [Adiantum nelumboides]
MAPLHASVLVATLLMAMAIAEGAGPSNGVSLSFPPFTSAINCSIDGMADTLLTPSQICIVRDGGKEVILSSDNVVSARYQYKQKVELWRSKENYAASFSTAYVASFLRSSDRVETGNFFSFGGGLAFAITPDQRVGSSGPESFGLFEIDDKTGKSLRGSSTKTVAVEIDLSRGTPTQSFNDPQIPHVGINIDSVKSASATSLGTFPQFVDRKIATFIDYDAQKELMQVRIQNLGFDANTTVQPDKSKARLYLNYRLRLSSLVNAQSYVGFSSRVPQDENGAYFLYSWTFSTTWVPVTYL